MSNNPKREVVVTITNRYNNYVYRYTVIVTPEVPHNIEDTELDNVIEFLSDYESAKRVQIREGCATAEWGMGEWSYN